MSRRLWRKV